MYQISTDEKPLNQEHHFDNIRITKEKSNYFILSY